MCENHSLKGIHKDAFPQIRYNQGIFCSVKMLDLSEPDTSLCVIGDPDQSIYGFRGSDVTYFQQFLEDYPGSRMIHLSQNYRSAETILKASHQVIRRHSISPSGADRPGRA